MAWCSHSAEGVVELGDVAEQRRLGQELADEGVHRLSDALEREHLGDEQGARRRP